MTKLSDAEVKSLYDALWDTGCHGFMGDHPELVTAVERIIAVRLDAERVRLMAALDSLMGRSSEWDDALEEVAALYEPRR